MTTVYERLVERYETGQLPWDDALPPPEVMETVAKLPAGRALDLGCGYGRASIYMAQQGWRVDGVDFVAQAITEARRRAAAAGVAKHIVFHAAPVTEMDFLTGPYDFALDVGCMHNFDPAQTAAYRDELHRLLCPGALYLLFAHLHHEDDNPEEEGRWMDAAAMRALFADGFVLEREEHGMTQVEDKPPWHSAWFWWRRKELA